MTSYSSGRHQHFLCSTVKQCKASITTDAKVLSIVKNKNEHVHGPNEHKTETQQLRVRVSKNSGDVCQRPSKIIRGELQKMEESLLDRKDLKNVAMSLYIERRKNMPRLPKCRADIREALDAIDTTTNKSQNFTLVNDQETDISCCRFHLGQNWWRRIQTIGQSTEYKERSSEVGKWLNQFFGLAFLSLEEIEDCFVEDIMAVTPQNEKCLKFSDYILENYVAADSKFPPQIWASPPDSEAKRTTNGPESFHSYFNSQFYTCHPSIFIFMDVFQKIQTTTYIKIRSLSAIAPFRKNDRERIEFIFEQFCQVW
ncbi:unnamed protein product [Mytilus coruscus]|uniref:FLYWCH-type domain-containing protein n=1 Tax=Mytilus coruscus TaxID=42192 RepID=A0A6J8CS80_MYTCO|nr:unnamed protein product [Mytilus coruscus]